MTSHPPDFLDAHDRHWEDAETLFGHQRWANADQLYGFSAECGLKAVMQALGMPIDTTTGTPPKKYRKHIQDLWPLFQTYAGSRNGATYLAMLPTGSPFADWSHHDRYAHQSYCPEPDAVSHRMAAKKLRPLVRHAQQNGPP